MGYNCTLRSLDDGEVTGAIEHGEGNRWQPAARQMKTVKAPKNCQLAAKPWFDVCDTQETLEVCLVCLYVCLYVCMYVNYNEP